MPTMYETIMELPLFKGIGEEQLNQMLEKTKIGFLKYDDGAIIAQVGDPVRAIDFVLSGRVRNTYKLLNLPIEIDEIIGKGAMIGATRIYGLDTEYCATSTALGRVSVMNVEKKQYMNILQSDKIYILNFVNYLSAAAQKGQKLMIQQKENSIRNTLLNLVLSVASRAAETVVICAADEVLAKYCGVSPDEFELWKVGELAHNRIMVNARGIVLKSAHLLK